MLSFNWTLLPIMCYFINRFRMYESVYVVRRVILVSVHEVEKSFVSNKYLLAMHRFSWTGMFYYEVTIPSKTTLTGDLIYYFWKRVSSTA